MSRPHARSTATHGSHAETTPDEQSLVHVHKSLQALHERIVAFEQSMASVLDHVHSDRQDSARNLLHYIGFRRDDVRELQEDLAALGLSSLGRAEECLLSSVQRVLDLLERSQQMQVADRPAAPVEFEQGRELLTRNTDALFGPAPPHRQVRIMVTMSTEAAQSFEHVRTLLENGMDCMRINCAHDDRDAWLRMIDHLKQAMELTQRQCKVLMDLAGPKLRTGPIAPGPAIHRWRPTRNVMGRVIRPVTVLLTASAHVPAPDADFQMVVPPPWLKAMRADDQVVFKDARHSERKVRVMEVGPDHAVGVCQKTAYLTPGLKLRLRRRSKNGKKWQTLDHARLHHVPPTEQSILVKPGERLFMTARKGPGHPAVRDEAGNVLEPAVIGCTIPEVFADLQVGHAIWYDDGKVGGRLVQVAPESVEIEITHAHPDGSTIGADKGINLPETHLRLASLTDKDLEDLQFVVDHADLVGYSFVRTPQDVAILHQHLHRLGGDQLGIVLKIETREAFEQLPHLLLSAMRGPCAGVMIARGDLAVECGYERLAELQEEILWFCEAAHTPVIWATQVLEHLAKEGTPSRAEITDAAMGVRAECVMLNKGPHIVEAVKTLDDILTRMAAHQMKKRAMLRPLHLAGRFGE
ncbi:MAG TPA: pyruvate kinase [Gemmataceae bacterium]|nr:pyruvate kinase [Gemmataceae bacterium]